MQMSRKENNQVALHYLNIGEIKESPGKLKIFEISIANKEKPRKENKISLFSSSSPPEK
jgi:hypothetical protein